MLKETKKEQIKRKLDLQLDRELEDTFPASDALKITRRSQKSRVHRSRPARSKRKVKL